MGTTSKEEIFGKVSELMSSLFDIDKASITSESTFESLGLTSLDAIDLIVELQSMTGKKVDEEAVKNIRTVADIVDMVDKTLNS